MTIEERLAKVEQAIASVVKVEHFTPTRYDYHLSKIIAELIAVEGASGIDLICDSDIEIAKEMARKCCEE